MTVHTDNSRRALASVCTLMALALISPTGAVAASSTTHKNSVLGLLGGASTHAPSTTTTAAATTTQAPATTTPASGAQPGTVAPGATPTTATPTTSVPTTAPPPSTATPTTTAPTGVTPGSSTTVVGVARKAAPSTRLSTGALALAVLGALLALGCAVWLVGRWMALEPRWTISMMHSLREASYHASATWAEFSDWSRLGR